MDLDLDLMDVAHMAVEKLAGTIRDWDLGYGGQRKASAEIGSRTATGTGGDAEDDFER